METGNFLGQCVSKTPGLDGGKGSETSSAFNHTNPLSRKLSHQFEMKAMITYQMCIEPTQTKLERDPDVEQDDGGGQCSMWQ